MTRFFAHANYDFIRLRHYAYAVTAVLVIPGLVFLLFKGLNYSIEFTGGTLVQVQSKSPVDVGALRIGLDKNGVHGAEIQGFGGANEFVVRARVAREGSDVNDTQAAAAAVTGALDAVLGAGSYTIVRTEAVGPKVGGELRQKAFLAILLSFFAVLAYLAYRFEWRFGLAAVIATAHDILATIAFISIMRLEVSLTVVAAVLSMVGYSLNDTIIIFDRVRENLRKHKKEGFADILNRSINETLPRSVLTHGTTLFVAAGAHDLRRRGDPALRAGHVLRRVHRHLLVDLHRVAGAHGHRAPLARSRRPWTSRGSSRPKPAAGGAEDGGGGVKASG